MTKLDTSKTEWDLSPLLAGDDDPKIEQYRTAIDEATDAFVAKWKERTDYLEDPKALREALDDYEAWSRIPGMGNVDYYFHLLSSVDNENKKVNAGLTQASDHLKAAINKIQFFWLNLGKVSANLQPRFLAADELKDYRHIIERTFAEAKYKLSEPEEKILLLKSSVAKGNWAKMTSDLLNREEREVQLGDGSKKTASMSTILGLFEDKDKKVRDGAAEAFNDILASRIDVAEIELNSVLEDKKINDELRGYDRPDQSRHISDDIDTEVVDALVEAVTDTNELMHRYYKLKAKLLGLPKLAFHERSLSYGEVDKKYTYQESVELVHSAFSEIDPQFSSIFENFVNEGRIDVYPRKGKRNGAFCAYNRLAHPVYVMLNHTDKLRDVTTLAHEMGHGINDELIKLAQKEMNYSTPLSTAEVASTFFEAYVLERLLADADDELRLSILVDELGDTLSTIHRQIGIYRFEQEVHRDFRSKGYLSKEEIGALWRKNNEAYMGPAVEQSPGAENWWVYVPHLRMYFYVYSYASGLLISKAMRAKVKQNPAFIQDVKKFLSAGLSKSPKEIFADMGIDITDKAFWQEGLKEIEKQLDETEALAKKLGKI